MDIRDDPDAVSRTREANAEGRPKAKDPVCGMEVDPAGAAGLGAEHLDLDPVIGGGKPARHFADVALDPALNQGAERRYREQAQRPPPAS